MRIPSESKANMNMTVQSQPTANAEKTDSQTGAIKVGQQISGALASVSGDKAVVILKDGTSLALMLDGEKKTILKGQAVQVTITGVSEGVISGTIEGLAEDGDRMERLDKMLTQLGVDTGPKQREALSMVMRYGLSVNGLDVNAIKQEGIQIDKLVQLAPDLENGLLEQVEDLPLKDALKHLLSSMKNADGKGANASSGASTGGAQSGIPLSQSAQLTLQTMTQPLAQPSTQPSTQQATQSIAQPSTQSITQPAAHPNTQQSTLLIAEQSPQLPAEASDNLSSRQASESSSHGLADTRSRTASEGSVGAGSLEGLKTIIVETLKQGSSMEKATFLKVLDVENTIKNLIISEHLLGGKGKLDLNAMSDGMIKGLTNLSKEFLGIEGRYDRKLLELALRLEGTSLTDLDEQGRLMDETKELMETLSKNEQSASTLSKEIETIKENLSIMKDGVDLLKQASQNLGFVQLKMMYDDEPAQFEMAYRKRKKSPGDGDRILISLDTHHIGLVQSLIDMRQHSVSIQFHVDTLEVKAEFESVFDELEALIRPILEADGKPWNLHIGFYGEEMTIKSLFIEDQPVNEQGGFDRFA